LRGGQVMGWVATWVSAPALLLIPLFCFLWFLDGRLPAARWRLVAWLDGLILAMATVGLAVRPGPLAVLPSVANPLGASGMVARLAGGLLAVATLLLPLAVSGLGRVADRSSAPSQRGTAPAAQVVCRRGGLGGRHRHSCAARAGHRPGRVGQRGPGGAERRTVWSLPG
jgi:hypothetical protein